MLNILDISKVLNRFISQRRREKKKKPFGVKVLLNGIGVTIKDSVKL